MKLTELSVVRDGNHAFILNRLSSDGDIALFQKASSTIGIGVSAANNLYISGEATNHAGLTFGTDAVLPTRQGAVIDDVTDLGSSSERFDDV